VEETEWIRKCTQTLEETSEHLSNTLSTFDTLREAAERSAYLADTWLSLWESSENKNHASSSSVNIATVMTSPASKDKSSKSDKPAQPKSILKQSNREPNRSHGYTANSRRKRGI